MKLLILLLLLPFLASCTLYENLMSVATKANETMVAANEAVAEAKATYAEHAKAADTNKDGETDLTEWGAYALALLGGGGLVRERMKRRNDLSDVRKANIEKDVDVLKAKVLS